MRCFVGYPLGGHEAKQKGATGKGLRAPFGFPRFLFAFIFVGFSCCCRFEFPPLGGVAEIAAALLAGLVRGRVGAGGCAGCGFSFFFVCFLCKDGWAHCRHGVVPPGAIIPAAPAVVHSKEPGLEGRARQKRELGEAALHPQNNLGSGVLTFWCLPLFAFMPYGTNTTLRL